MTLKSPRRRGSPRARRRYLSFNGLFRRTLSKSSSSRSNIKSNSEEKHNPYETQLHDTAVLKSDTYPVLHETPKEIKSISSRSNKSDHQNSSNTKIIYKTKKQPMASDECSDNKISYLESKVTASSKLYKRESKRQDIQSNYRNPMYVQSESTNMRRKKSYNRRRDKNETSTSYHCLSKKLPAYSYKDIHPSGDKRTLLNLNTNYKPVIDRYRTEEPLICHEDVINYHNSKKRQKELDDKYIERLIRKQYKHNKLVNGYDQSEFSQFSAPICRDHIDKLRKINEEYYNEYNKKYYSEIESFCDTKLHNNRKISRNKQQTKHTDMYNNSDFYDVIPVREKPSSEYHCIQKAPLKYIDVPPSPKTRRPKLNLQPHYVPDTEDFPISTKTLQKDSDQPTNNQYRRENNDNYNLEAPQVNNVEQTSNNVLNEIKDVLQNFLVDIRKDSLAQNEEKSFMATPKTNEQIPNSFNNSSFSGNQIRSDFNTCSGPPYIPQYNPCYPAVPFYPMQSAYVIPSCSLTCSNCIHGSKICTIKVSSEPSIKSAKYHKINKKDDDVTQELIKEIYKCVTQKQNENNICDENFQRKKTKDTEGIINSDCERVKKSQYSKSCEAFGSKIMSESSILSHSIMSDTKLLDRRSVDVTVAPTPSQSILSTDSATTVQKKKHNKFRKLLQTLGLGKSKKKYVEYANEHYIPPYTNNPYKRDILNYMVHDQEFYSHPLPPNRNRNIQHNHHDMRPPRPEPNIGDFNYPVPHTNAYHHPGYFNPYHERAPDEFRNKPQMHSNNPYGGPPVCFKEIEVRSTATQSDTKNKSFFSAFRKKNRSPTNIDEHNNISTQTKAQFSWKKNDIDPIKFTLKQNQKLAQGDITMRNAILKKLFKKRNPFSPNNLLVKTLLGKDKSSYGEPKMFKTRMFF